MLYLQGAYKTGRIVRRRTFFCEDAFCEVGKSKEIGEATSQMSVLPPISFILMYDADRPLTLFPPYKVAVVYGFVCLLDACVERAETIRNIYAEVACIRPAHIPACIVAVCRIRFIFRIFTPYRIVYKSPHGNPVLFQERPLQRGIIKICRFGMPV